MRVAIASSNERTVAYHLGRAQGFVVVHIEGDEVKERTYRPVSLPAPRRGMHLPMHPGVVGSGHGHRHGHPGHDEEEAGGHRHGHGQGHGVAVVATVQDCDAVISRGAGAGMVRHLKAAGKTLYLTELTSVDDALSAFLRGELREVSTA